MTAPTDDERPQVAAEPVQLPTMVLVSVGGTLLGLLVRYVKDICDDLSITRLPTAPVHIPGICPHRGRGVPLLDVKRFLDLPGAPWASSEKQRYILVEAESMCVAIPCDASMTFVDPKREGLAPLSAAVHREPGLRRFTMVELDTSDGIVAVLDIPALLLAARLR